MYQDPTVNDPNVQDLAQLGNNAVAYMREITSEEIFDKFPHVEDINPGMLFWAMFAADGSLLILADSENDLTQTAFYNDLKAIRLN